MIHRLLLPVLLAPALLAAQAPKADLPFQSVEFSAAVAKGTRTATGAPGTGYWQPYTRYQLAATINPRAKRLYGTAKLRYLNRSPVALPSLFVHLHGNLFELEAKRNTVTTKLGGMRLTKVAAAGAVLDSVKWKDKKKVGYAVEGTILEVRLAQPVAAGDSIDLEFAWNHRIPPEGGPRGGQDNETWMLTYWYPQMAVHDDVNGWQIDPYLGRGEFYMGFADYDVKLTVPAGWLVQGTGSLLNAEQVLTPQVRERLALAAKSDTVVQVVGDSGRGVGKATQGTDGGTLEWHFGATNVRDFVFGASPLWLWDAQSAPTADGGRTLAQAFYRPQARGWFWGGGTRYIRHAVGVLSKELWAYPWPHMTAVEGPSGCGGMEYPMMTCIGVKEDSLQMVTTFAHEIAHMWFPMQVGSDEKRYAWQDEGIAQFLQGVVLEQWTADRKGDYEQNRDTYLRFIRRFGEEPILTPSDRFDNELHYAVAAYYKPVAIFMALQGIIGEDLFTQALRRYGQTWQYKHPQPEDFYHMVDAVAEKDLRWFWKSWFDNTETLDLGIDTVIVLGDSAEVHLERKGGVAMPIPVQVTRVSGLIEIITVGERVWADGRKKYVLAIPDGGSPVRRIRIDPERRFPYVDRYRHEWRK